MQLIVLTYLPPYPEKALLQHSVTSQNIQVQSSASTRKNRVVQTLVYFPVALPCR